MSKTLRILGSRGIPAAHGGFETFAQTLALDLVAQGWQVVVYCQLEGSGPLHEDRWQGVHRVLIPVPAAGTLGTMVFDWRAIAHAAQHADLCLTLGYNTALFCARLRLAGVPNLINMDGIEWRRAKWGLLAKAWFWINERAACWLAEHLVADHPLIQAHLARRVDAARISTIPYGADTVQADPGAEPRALGLRSGGYLSVVARAEPENSMLEIVRAFSARPRGIRLAVLGHYDERHAYPARVRASASDEVLFLGPIYDPDRVQQLRAHALGYIHGHSVGGTNPSLVEALAAHNPVFAHDNPFNRWVAGEGAAYFSDEATLDEALTRVLADPQALLRMRRASAARHAQGLSNEAVMLQYRGLLERWLPATVPSRQPVR